MHKTIFSLQAIQKEVTGWIWLVGSSILTPDLEHWPESFNSNGSRKIY
jgi:hypothetical protein